MQLRNIAIETNVLNLLWSNSTCPSRQITDKQQQFSLKKESYVSLYNVNICEFIFWEVEQLHIIQQFRILL